MSLAMLEFKSAYVITITITILIFYNVEAQSFLKNRFKNGNQTLSKRINLNNLNESQDELNITHIREFNLNQTKISECFNCSSWECGKNKTNNIPWMVVIEHTDPSQIDTRKTLSKGVLISNLHVLTTVSSIYNSLPSWIVSAVRIGDFPSWLDTTTPDPNKNNTFTIEIDKVYQHKSDDIAIIKLSSKVNFSESIMPICLPPDDSYNFRELILHMCKRYISHLRDHDVQLLSVKPLSPQDCNIMFKRKGAIITMNQFCAWDEIGDTCTGDIGGPLMTFFNEKFYIVGLNSYIPIVEPYNENDYPGIYVKVGKYLKWISSIITMD